MGFPVIKSKVRLSIEGLTKLINDEFDKPTLADKTIDLIWSLELSEEGEELKLTPNFSPNVFDLTYLIPNKEGRMDLLNLEIDLDKLKLHDVYQDRIVFGGNENTHLMKPKSIMVDLKDEIYIVTFE